jgi:hypothetical protein
VDLGQIVRDFALAREAVDHRRPQATSHRNAAKLYQPGIGPFGEDAAVAMTVAEMQAANAGIYAIAGKRRYPDSSHVCDLALGALPDWAIEVKLARLGRDNGTYEDAAIKKSSRRTPKTAVRSPTASSWLEAALPGEAQS